VLPTLAVILWAYGMYALISGMSRRKALYLRGRPRWRGYGWLALLGTTGAGLAFLLHLTVFADKPEHSLKLTGFLGTVWAEGWPEKVNRVEYPTVKDQGPGDKPAYATLHPETPPIQAAPEKNGVKPRLAPKPKARKAAAPVKTAKNAATSAKKDKVAAKTKPKKKKAAAPEGRKAASG
jgi:hypothetical protein